MGLFFELQQPNVPQKITFFMKIYDYDYRFALLKQCNFVFIYDTLKLLLQLTSTDKDIQSTFTKGKEKVIKKRRNLRSKLNLKHH